MISMALLYRCLLGAVDFVQLTVDRFRRGIVLGGMLETVGWASWCLAAVTVVWWGLWCLREIRKEKPSVKGVALLSVPACNAILVGLWHLAKMDRFMLVHISYIEDPTLWDVLWIGWERGMTVTQVPWMLVGFSGGILGYLAVKSWDVFHRLYLRTRLGINKSVNETSTNPKAKADSTTSIG